MNSKRLRRECKTMSDMSIRWQCPRSPCSTNTTTVWQWNYTSVSTWIFSKVQEIDFNGVCIRQIVEFPDALRLTKGGTYGVPWNYLLPSGHPFHVRKHQTRLVILNIQGRLLFCSFSIPRAFRLPAAILTLPRRWNHMAIVNFNTVFCYILFSIVDCSGFFFWPERGSHQCPRSSVWCLVHTIGASSREIWTCLYLVWFSSKFGTWIALEGSVSFMPCLRGWAPLVQMGSLSNIGKHQSFLKPCLVW